MIKVLEDMLTKKSSTEKSEVGDKEKELPSVVKKSLKTLLKQAETKGITKKDLIKFLKSE